MGNALIRRRKKKDPTWYGIKIDQNNADAEAACTYIGSAVGFTPLRVNRDNGICNYGSWKSVIDNVFKPKPCLLKSRRNVFAYLNPNDFSKTVSGESADINSGNSGDVMIEFSKCWYSFELTDNGRYLTFKVTGDDMTGEKGWTCAAFAEEDGSGIYADKFYYGAYEGSCINGKLRSLHSQNLLTHNVYYWEYRQYATANGAGYQIETYTKRMYILGLLLLVTKSRDLQTAIGFGIADDTDWGGRDGSVPTRGLFYGYNNGGYHVITFGIENLWGNLHHYVDGIAYSTYGFFYKESGPYRNPFMSNNDASPIDLSLYGYKKFPFTHMPIGIITKMAVYENAILYPASVIAYDSSIKSSYYADLADCGLYTSDGNYAVGGNYESDYSSGPFTIYDSGDSYSNARLICA